MDILQQAGASALGSRFRRLAERLSLQAAEVYKHYELKVEPAWFPVLYALNQHGAASITELAGMTGQSHPLISKSVKQLQAAGLLKSVPSKADKRVHTLTLSEQGKALMPVLDRQVNDIGQALSVWLNDVSPDFLKALEKLENGLNNTSLIDLVTQRGRLPEGYRVVPFRQGDENAFYTLNKIWIERHFEMEDSDRAALLDPQNYIVNKGGHILLMLAPDGSVCGTVALIAMPKHTFELAKMSVSDAHQGRGLGFELGLAAISLARRLKAKRLFLESNRKLTPAIHLYEKLGFTEVTDSTPSPYSRCDIQMQLDLH